MPGERARYDAIADWYVEFTSAWDPQPVSSLPEDLTGTRIVDLACGEGRTSRYLAGRGARITGIDVAPSLVEIARQRAAEENRAVDFMVGDVTNTDWWDGRPFDGALSNMSLMDVDDLTAAMAVVRIVLVPDGWFSFSIFHPCYPGGSTGSASGEPSWPPAGYASEGWWAHDGTGVRNRVGAHHRMLSTYLNAVVRTGFEFVAFSEPTASVPVLFSALCRRR